MTFKVCGDMLSSKVWFPSMCCCTEWDIRAGADSWVDGSRAGHCMYTERRPYGETQLPPDFTAEILREST